MKSGRLCAVVISILININDNILFGGKESEEFEQVKYLVSMFRYRNNNKSKR